MKLLKVLLILIFPALVFAQSGTMNIHLSDKSVKHFKIDKIESITFATQGGMGTIVVLGSSTAAGNGPSSIDSAWVNRYRTYLLKFNIFNKVINLAVGGYTTYHIMPNGYTPPSGKPAPSVGHNITKALALNPTAIIINLPSNDAARGYSVEEQIDNYKTVINLATAANVPVWIATPQPVNYSTTIRESLIEMRDSTYSIWGNKAINFWTTIATSTGKINSQYNSGDGTHLNSAAHKILFERVAAKDIFR